MLVIEGRKLLRKLSRVRHSYRNFLDRFHCDGLSLAPHAQLCLSCIATRHSCIPANSAIQDLGCVILAAPPFNNFSGCCLLFTPPPHPHIVSHIWADVPTNAMSLAPISIVSIVIGFISFSFTLAIVGQRKVLFRNSRQCRTT